MTTEQAISVICQALHPNRPADGDDGLQSMEQAVVAMYLRSYINFSEKPEVGPTSKTAWDRDEANLFRHALAHILREVRREAQR
jgi:hypothetical protein